MLEERRNKFFYNYKVHFLYIEDAIKYTAANLFRS